MQVPRFLNPADAARRLGISPKALRIYEERGLIGPLRTGAGWRVYGPAEMERAGAIVGLRALGLSLAAIGRALSGDAAALADALAAQDDALQADAGRLSERIARVRRLRATLGAASTSKGKTVGVDAGGLARVMSAMAEVAPGTAEGVSPASRGPAIAFDLPWPWGGERFSIDRLARLTFLTGPLFSGKTRLAQAIAAAIPGGAYLGPDRALPGGAVDLSASPAARAALAWLAEDGASPSAALDRLVGAIEAKGPAALVVDMVEDGIDAGTQAALVAHLRRRTAAAPLVLMTRSTAILDLEAVGPGEAILFCPANHAPPRFVVPVPGAAGYEALESCLAAPEVRARTGGVRAVGAAG